MVVLFEVFFPCLLSIIMRSLRIMALFHISASLFYIQFNRRWGFPGSSSDKESACNAGDPSLIPGSGRSTEEGTGYSFQYSWASQVAQLVKSLPVIWETWVRSLGWEDPLEESMATHSSILAWRIPWSYKESDTAEWLSLSFNRRWRYTCFCSQFIITGCVTGSLWKPHRILRTGGKSKKANAILIS